ncbi:MAG: acetyl-CoA carboxylase biotin carboxyl carrier protein subunit [Candidatus Kapaibacterium sp.]
MDNKDYTILVIDDTKYNTKLNRKYIQRKPFEKKDPYKLKAFIPGTIKEIFIAKGDIVSPGEDILILEAMKMKNVVKSDIKAKVAAIHVKNEQKVAKHDIIVEFEKCE